MDRQEILALALKRAKMLTWQEYERRAKEILENDPDLKIPTLALRDDRGQA